jgi:hypothetical protein
LFSSSLYIVPVVSQVCCARILLNIRDVMSPPNCSETAIMPWSGSTRNNQERQFGAASTNADGGGSRSRPRHKQLDSFGAGLGFESWEMHRVSMLRHAMQLRDPQHSDEDPFEVEAELDITPGISHGGGLHRS